MTINLLHLRTFVEVIRQGSFVKAASALAYTPSAVSQQISALEADLGVQLFERSPRSVRPTAASHVLATRAVDIIDRLTVLRRDLSSVASGMTGQMHMGSFTSAASKLVPRALVDLRREYPAAEVSMVEGEPEDLVPGLLAGESDAVVAYSYVSVPGHWPDTLIVDSLMTEELVLVVSSDHRLAGRFEVALTELAEDTWISIKRGTDGDRVMTDLCAKAGFEPNIAFRCNDYDVIRQLVKANLGVALIASLGYSADTALHPICIRPHTHGRKVQLLRRRTNSNPLVDSMLGFLHESAETYHLMLTSSIPGYGDSLLN